MDVVFGTKNVAKVALVDTVSIPTYVGSISMLPQQAQTSTPARTNTSAMGSKTSSSHRRHHRSDYLGAVCVREEGAMPNVDRRVIVLLTLH